LLKLPETSRICGRRRESDAWKLTQTEWTCLYPSTKGKTDAEDIGRSDFYDHEQWLSLNHPNAKAIAAFNFHRFDRLDQYYGSKQFHMRTPERQRLKSNASKEGYEKHVCADEYYFGTALRAAEDADRAQQKCLMYSFRANVGEPSPVVWTSWTKSICVSNEKNEEQTGSLTLLQAATVAYKAGAFFFRKIGPESKLLWPGPFQYDGSAVTTKPDWKRAADSASCQPTPVQASGQFAKWSTVNFCPTPEPVRPKSPNMPNKKAAKLPKTKKPKTKTKPKSKKK
jgi:hypothetical protein